MKLRQRIIELLQEPNTIGRPAITLNIKGLTYDGETLIKIFKIAQKAQEDINKAFDNENVFK